MDYTKVRVEALRKSFCKHLFHWDMLLWMLVNGLFDLIETFAKISPFTGVLKKVVYLF